MADEVKEVKRVKFYNVPVFGCVDPSLDGPYTTAEQRDEAAKKLHGEQSQEDALFWLDLDENGEPHIGSFTNADFTEDEDSDEAE